uniref:O-methyltransferase n=2 Tax=Roseivirga sp. TaxID=1964215 RepID=UPI00404712DF
MYLLLAYIKYWLLSVDEHSLHSPFLYKFYTQVVKSKSNTQDPVIEELRKQLLKNETTIEIEEMGAGSRVNSSNARKISEIAKHSATPTRFSLLLSRIIQQYDFKSIVELGTSLGLNTAYLAKSNKEVKVTTFEGNGAIAELANQHFEQLGLKNIALVHGNIDQTLEDWLETATNIDLAYLDANHRYEPTIRYFSLLLPKMNQQGIIILDDIHWSKEMNLAWHELKNHPQVSLSIDLFEGGILFLNTEIPRDQYILSF